MSGIITVLVDDDELQGCISFLLITAAERAGVRHTRGIQIDFGK